MATEASPGKEVKCDHCKKPIIDHRLSVIYLIKDALSQVFNLDRGLLFTLVEMVKRPGVVIRAFVEGNRFRYMNPFRFLLISATAALLAEALAGTSELVSFMNVDDSETRNAFLNFVQDNIDFVILLTVPFFSLGSYLVFRKPKWNYAEHLVLNAYALSTITIAGSLLSVLITPLSGEVRLMIESSSQLLNLFLGFVFIKTWGYGWLKGILLMLLSFVVTMLSIIVFAIVVAFIINLI